MKKAAQFFYCLALFLAAGSFPVSAADVYLQIQRGEKVSLALPDFVPKGSDAAELLTTRELRDTVRDDILFTRLFNLAESEPSVREGKIDFAGWGDLGTDVLIKGNVGIKEGKVSFTASVFEIPSGNPVFQKIYRTALHNANALAHEFVADFIYRFTGNRGISSSRIAFVNDASGSKELCVIDYDGKNMRRLTSDKSIAILPRWAPDGKSILYTSFKDGNPDLALYSFETGKSKMISRHLGLNVSGSFSPDGKTIVATLSYQDSPNLYLLDLSGNIIRRLTNSKFSDVSASFSADGRKLVFVSDRSGSPQIYIMDLDGLAPDKISSGGWCDSPVWSPLGDKIAYSRGDTKGNHDIVIFDLATSESITVTSDSGKNENPSFSPDGRFVAFASNRNRKSEIYIAAIGGSIEKKLSDVPGSSFTPAWGP